MTIDYQFISIHGIKLQIPNSVIKIWSSYRQLAPLSTEACGTIIGGKDLSADHYWIDIITEPQIQDIRKRFSFIMRDNFHQNAANNAFKESNGKSIYLGTWHTHPESSPTPSNLDIQDWKACMKRNPDRRLFFVIVGNKKLSYFHFLRVPFMLPFFN